MHVSPAQKWRQDLQTPPTSLYLGRHDRERQKSCFFSSVVAQIHWHGCANMPHDLCCVVRVLYTSTHVHTCSLRCFLHPADTPCRGHVLVLLLDCSAVYGRSVTICPDGTARRQAGTWRVPRLPGDRPLLCSCLGRRMALSAHCCLWLSALWLHQACRWASDCGPPMFCVCMWPCCLGRVIYTKTSKKGWKWPSLSASPSHRGLRWVLSTGCLSLLTVLLPVAFILFIISVTSGCKIDTLLSHTSIKIEIVFFFNRNSLFSFYF